MNQRHATCVHQPLGAVAVKPKGGASWARKHSVDYCKHHGPSPPPLLWHGAELGRMGPVNIKTGTGQRQQQCQHRLLMKGGPEVGCNATDCMLPVP